MFLPVRLALGGRNDEKKTCVVLQYIAEQMQISVIMVAEITTCHIELLTTIYEGCCGTVGSR